MSPDREPANSFADQVPRYARQLHSRALRLTGNPADAEDLVHRLPGHLVTTVYLADVQGYRYAEIAELTGVPIGTVMSRLHRARTRLRTMLAGQVRPGLLPCH